jgi:hypothetical protein
MGRGWKNSFSTTTSASLDLAPADFEVAGDLTSLFLEQVNIPASYLRNKITKRVLVFKDSLKKYGGPVGI